MLKKIINSLFNTSFAEKKILFKELFLTDEDENITRAIKLVKGTVKDLSKEFVIADIGAFDGHTAQLFSKAFPNNAIHAFEANEEMYKLAHENCRSYSNIKIKNCAISDKNEKLIFNITSNNVSSSLNQVNVSAADQKDYQSELMIKKQEEVEAFKLDNLLTNERLILLKIDTQGHELKVLEGAKEVLKRTNYVLIEMSNHELYVEGCKYYEVDEWMRSQGFKLADIIVTYRKGGLMISEYDAIYSNVKLTK